MGEKYRFPLSESVRTSPKYGVTGECRKPVETKCPFFERGLISGADVDSALDIIKERSKETYGFHGPDGVFHPDSSVTHCVCGIRVEVYFTESGEPRLDQIQ